jgi:hypothetical protein
MAVPRTTTLSSPRSYFASNVQADVQRLGYWDQLETLAASIILEHGCRCPMPAPPRSRRLMVDAGANTGYFSAMALSAGCRVAAFEPNPKHEPYLRMSAALSDAGEALMLHQLVVSDVTGADIPFDGWSVVGSSEVGPIAKSVRIDDVVQVGRSALKE